MIRIAGHAAHARRRRDSVIAGMVLVLLLAASDGHAAASADSLSVIYPPDRSYVESEVIGVVVNTWPTMIDEIRISVNGMRQGLAPKPVDRYVMCYDGIHLRDGLNELTVAGLQKTKKVREVKVKVFRRSDLSEDASAAPAGFTKFLFHTREREKGCTSCHRLDYGENGAADAQFPCTACHAKMLNDYQNVHGPSASGDCLICHDRKSRNPKLAVPDPVSNICFGCHEDSWGKKKYRHAPTAAGMCATCHNPHASEFRYFLRKGTVDLCTSCHFEILTRPHVVNSFSNDKGHPLQNRRDPLRPGRILSCASCHNPHGENSRVFLNNYDESQSLHLFCLGCHKFN